MALIRNVSTHPLDLTSGRVLDPADEANVDVTLAHEAGLIADGLLLVVDGTVSPPAPTTKTVPVVTSIATTDPAHQVALDISGEATDAEVAAAIAAVGGRFRGAYASLTVGSPVKANDIVTNPSGALVSRIADGTIAGTYNPASWTALSAGSSAPVILPWATGTAYVTGQPVVASGATYTANDNHTAGATFAGDKSAHWTLLPAGSGVVILPWTGPGTLYKSGQAVTNGGHTYLATNDHTSGSSFASDLGAHWALLPVPGNAALLLGTDDTGVLNQLWKPEPPVTGNLVTGLSLPATVTNPTTTGTRLFRLDLNATSSEVPLAVRVLFKVSIPATASGFATAALVVGQRKADGTTHGQNIPNLDTTSPTTIDAVVASPGDSSKAMMNYVGMCEMEIGVFVRYLDISVLGVSGVFQGDVVLTELDVRYISAQGLPLRGGGESINADTISATPGSKKWMVDRAGTRPDGTIARARTMFDSDNVQEVAMQTGYAFLDSRYPTREPGGTVVNLDPFLIALHGVGLHVGNNDLIWSAKKGDGSYELRGNTHGGESGRTGDFHLDYIFEQDRIGDGDWRRLHGNSQQHAAYRMRYTLKTKVQRSDAGAPFANIDRVYTFFADGVTRVDRTVTMLADQDVNKLYYIMNSFDPASSTLRGRIGYAQSILRESNGQRPSISPITVDVAGAAAGQAVVPVAATAQQAFTLTGAIIRIGTGGNAENALVSSVAGSNLTLATNLVNTHASGDTLVILDDPTSMASSALAGASTISSQASVPINTYLVIDAGNRREIRQITAIAGTGPFTLTTDVPLDFNHPTGTPLQQISPSDYQIESGRAHWGVYREPRFGMCFGQVFDREGISAHGLGGNLTLNLVRNTRSSYIAKMYSAIVPPAAITLHSGLVLSDTYYFHYYVPQDDEAWHREISALASLTPADRNTVWSAT